MTRLLDAFGLTRAEVAAVLAMLRETGQTVATAESLTGGAVSAALTEVAGASAVVRGGLVVYATDLKTTLAGVRAEVLAEHGAVHPEVAAALAMGARERCAADLGLGLTGVAGPDSQDGADPGTVYLALAGPGEISFRKLHLDGDRYTVRAAAVRAAVNLLRLHVRR